MLKKIALLCIFILFAMQSAVFAQTGEATDRVKLMVTNDSAGMAVWYSGLPIVKGVPVTFAVNKPNLETNLGTLFFNYATSTQTGMAELFTVRAPAALWRQIDAGDDLKLRIYNWEDEIYADLSGVGDHEAKACYQYHSVLNIWGFVEADYGIVFYQDTKADFDDWQAAQDKGAEWRTAWEHLYPGQIDDWLRSPMESRGFIVPLTKIDNVSTWEYDDLMTQNLVRLTQDWPAVTHKEVVVVKTFGDFGWGMLAYQNTDKTWYFISYGYDGMGAHGDLWYRITDTPPKHNNPEADFPWNAK